MSAVMAMSFSIPVGWILGLLCICAVPVAIYYTVRLVKLIAPSFRNLNKRFDLKFVAIMLVIFGFFGFVITMAIVEKNQERAAIENSFPEKWKPLKTAVLSLTDSDAEVLAVASFVKQLQVGDSMLPPTAYEYLLANSHTGWINKRKVEDMLRPFVGWGKIERLAPEK